MKFSPLIWRVKSTMEIFTFFVAFLENTNFKTWLSWPSKTFDRIQGKALEAYIYICNFGAQNWNTNDIFLLDEKKSEHEESKTPPQRRMSLLHIGQKRFMKSHL